MNFQQLLFIQNATPFTLSKKRGGTQMHTNQRNSRLKSYGPESKNLRLISIICTSRNEFFLHRLIPLWNDLLQKIQEIKIIELFKTGLNRTELFKTNSICFYLQNSYYLLLLLFH